MKPLKIFGVFEDRKSIFTLNKNPGKQVYDEKLTKFKGKEYREWNPRKSKLGAYIKQGVNDIFIRPNSNILYLGVANGTTASHISDITDGMIFGVDPAYRTMIDLIHLCNDRKNIAPIMADAFQIDTFKHLVPKVDLIVQDVAQRNQAEIFMKNVEKFLKKGGFGLLVVKARSIDVSKQPKKIFKQVRKQLEEKYTIVDYRSLEPFEKDHVMIVIKN